MKRAYSLLTLSVLLGTGSGILGGCSSTSDAPEGVGESEVREGPLDDLVATTLLAGGCEVVDEGSVTKTAGQGGACPTKLSAILDLLDKQQSQVFVVSEEGDQPDASGHRFVIAAGGDKASKLFVATVSGGGGVSEDGVEAIGFSEKLGAFAFYKVEGGRWVRKGDGAQVKSQAKDARPAFECAACHTSGAPLMKELHDSWGNWHSTWFAMPGPKKQSAVFKRLFDKKERADLLEPLVIGGTKLHSKGRVERAVKEGNLKGIFTQLMCEVGEPSLIGVHSKSQSRVGKVSTSSTMLPTTVLLNPLFSPPRTGTGVELGLEQSLKANVPSLNSVGQSIDAAAYTSALAKNGQTIAGQPGDAMFAMFTPEKSYADLDAIQELLRRGLVDKDVITDALMTDFTVSAFSDVRCQLAETLPETWKDAKELKTEWAKNLASSNLRGAKGLAARLRDEGDFSKHEATLESFVKACVDRKGKNATAFTEDMVKIVSQRRVEFVERYASVVESPWLIPTDRLGSRPHAVRLSATTCEIEKSTEKLAGEE